MNTGLQWRIDYAPGDVVLVDAAEEPTPSRSPAVKTPEGYLVADALLARDGLLKYSDGESSWLELRPRDELVRAADSWTHKPVTDDHPPVMVDAKNATEYVRGFVVEAPRVVELDGVSYLRARIRVMDADLVAKILGGQTQLSIGFLADVHPERGVYAGAKYDAVQRELAGNHVASVVRGRAGPSVRILLDGACIAVHHESVSARPCIGAPDVSKPKSDKPDPKAPADPKADEAGSPATDTEVVGPEGTPVKVPTWLAAVYEWGLANGYSFGAKPSDEPKAADPAPAPGDELPPKDPAVPADPAAPKPEDKDKPMTPDAVNAQVRKRARLERLAGKAGIEDAKIDAADDIALARLVVETKCPRLKARADKAEGDALDTLVEVAALEPEPTEAPNPFEVRRAVKDSKPDEDPEVKAYAEHLVRSGCR